jgi:hypothetical protein
MTRRVLWIDNDALEGLRPLAVAASLAEDLDVRIATTVIMAEQALRAGDIHAIVFDLSLGPSSPSVLSGRKPDRAGLRLLEAYLSDDFAVDETRTKVAVGQIGVMTIDPDREVHHRLASLGIDVIVVKSSRMSVHALEELFYTLLDRRSGPPA